MSTHTAPESPANTTGTERPASSAKPPTAGAAKGSIRKRGSNDERPQRGQGRIGHEGRRQEGGTRRGCPRPSPARVI